MGVCSGFVHDCSNTEATSAYQEVNGYTAVHLDKGILCTTEEKWVITPGKDVERARV
jgi:hypothetical protein